MGLLARAPRPSPNRNPNLNPNPNPTPPATPPPATTSVPLISIRVMGGNSEVQIPDPVAESKGAGVSVSRVPDKVAPAESMKAESKHAERVKGKCVKIEPPH